MGFWFSVSCVLSSNQPVYKTSKFISTLVNIKLRSEWSFFTLIKPVKKHWNLACYKQREHFNVLSQINVWKKATLSLQISCLELFCSGNTANLFLTGKYLPITWRQSANVYSLLWNILLCGDAQANRKTFDTLCTGPVMAGVIWCLTEESVLLMK